MNGNTRSLVKAVLLAGLTIGSIVEGLFALASVITGLLGFPAALNLDIAIRLSGGVLSVAGLGLVLWLAIYRSPLKMIVSTYYTFAKMFTRAPVSKLEGRTEPLVVSGPQRYVRHPLYLGAIVVFLGWGLFTGRTSSLLGVVFILLWFRLVQIPFEERELRALFGDQYSRYSEAVPMLIPINLKRSGRSGSSSR